LQDHVAREENPKSEAEDTIVESKIVRHANRSVGHAGAVQEIDDVEQKQKRQKANGNLAPRASCPAKGSEIPPSLIKKFLDFC